jgi:hypothetical protein
MSTFRDQLQGNAVALTAGQVANSSCTGSTPITTPLGQMPCNFPMTKSGSFQQTLPRDGIQVNARVDHRFNDGKDQIYGSFYRTTNQLVTFGAPSVYPDFTTIQPQYTNYGNLKYTHIFSPTLLNEMAVGATRAYGEAPLAHWLFRRDLHSEQFRVARYDELQPRQSQLQVRLPLCER